MIKVSKQTVIQIISKGYCLESSIQYKHYYKYMIIRNFFITLNCNNCSDLYPGSSLLRFPFFNSKLEEIITRRSLWFSKDFM